MGVVLLIVGLAFLVAVPPLGVLLVGAGLVELLRDRKIEQGWAHVEATPSEQVVRGGYWALMLCLGALAAFVVLYTASGG